MLDGPFHPLCIGGRLTLYLDCRFTGYGDKRRSE